jgi:exonuclease III
MEMLGNKLGVAFNSVQIVAYIPEGLVEEDSQFVGMNWHADDEQYLSGEHKQHLDEVAIGTLNFFTSNEDIEWNFNVRPKGTLHSQHK